jgi:serine/threonine-protein kinase
MSDDGAHRARQRTGNAHEMARTSQEVPSDSARGTALAPGSKLDGYELLWPVGEGGMATVWVARLLRKHGFEKLVAIKTILPKFAEDEAFQTMFLDEARIASRIDHTNVAHIHDLGEQDDILYLVMEYVDGDALTRLRKIVNKRGGTFPIGIALRIMADVCAGLHAAHELKGVDGTPLGVVHRDISPQNILITTDGTSKLIDFGVAKAAGRLTAETHTGYVKGKVPYMAPEQALGRNVDRRADIWAVGAVIYHLVANRPPFEADNQLALLNLLQKGRPPSPLPADVPAPVQDLVRKALTHNPMMRFQTAAEMRSAIERTGLASTSEEVAELVRTHLGDLAERRRNAIASAIQSLEGTGTAARRILQAPPTPTSAMPITNASATQRLDPSQLPPPRPYSGQPSDPQIGPPTPPSFPSAQASGQTRAQDPRRTEPVAVALSPYAAGAGSGSTEPLPPPELYDNAFNDHTSGAGSLGLASTSSSISTRGPRRTPLIAAAIGGVAALVVVLALAVSVSRGGNSARRLESEFSPLPSSAMPASATATMTAVPPPPAADELPSAPAPEPTRPPAAAPAPIAHPTPVSTPVPKPAPAASTKKPKPRVDDGF